MSIVGVNTIWCENCGRKHKSYRLIGIKLRMCFCVGIFRMKLPGLSQEKCFLHHLHALQSGRSLSQCWVLIGQVLNGRCWCQSKEQVLQQQCYHGNRGATTKIDQFDWQVQSFLDQNSCSHTTMMSAVCVHTCYSCSVTTVINTCRWHQTGAKQLMWGRSLWPTWGDKQLQWSVTQLINNSTDQ